MRARWHVVPDGRGGDHETDLVTVPRGGRGPVDVPEARSLRGCPHVFGG